MTDKRRTRDGSRLVSRKELDNGDMEINAGPTIFPSPCESCIHFTSGAGLCFGITLRSADQGSKILAYRFYLQLPSRSGLSFLGFDLNPPKDDYDPLHQPRSHMHPGFEGIHIPFPVMPTGGPGPDISRII